METFYLYLFVKLNDINTFLAGVDLTLIPFLVIGLMVLMGGFVYSMPWEDDEQEKINEFLLPCLKWGKKTGWKILLVLWLIEKTCNFTALFLPTTGQAAAIYLGATAIKSDTAQVLSNLPVKYATLLENKADEWLEGQIQKGTSAMDEKINDVIGKESEK